MEAVLSIITFTSTYYNLLAMKECAYLRTKVLARDNWKFGQVLVMSIFIGIF
jgi:hypothetical protein